MPELAELEVYAKNLEGRFKDRILESIEVVSLQFVFRRGRVMNLHLMISGQIKILEPEEKTEFSIVVFRFQGGDGFALTDPKRQAALVLSRAD